MRISRRELLFGAGAAAGTAVLAGAGLATSTFVGLAPVDASQLTYAMMLRHAGSTFTVHTAAMQRVDLRLASVIDLSTPAAKARPGQCFSMVFEGSGKDAVAPGTYVVEHSVLGKLMLFLSPVNMRTPGKPSTYEAIVNRLA
ncbi:MAG TPA: hypothetical protein VN193_07165 [Candidatus Angelobacter sp.]|nr:hypothetical protein [Candidatus Angelobacter sp.]